VFFTAMSVDSGTKIFNDKMKELNDACSHRSLFLDNKCYNNILREFNLIKKKLFYGRFK